MAELNDPRGDFNPYAPPAAFADVPPPDLRGDDILIPAERGTRWVARVIDTVLWIVTAIPAIAALVSDKDQVLLVGGLSSITLGFLSYQWYRISTTGQTLGKKWLGIRVVKLDGTPVNFVSGVVLREWVLSMAAFIPAVGRVIGLVDSLMIFGNERRCLHDQIAGTRVVLALPST